MKNKLTSRKFWLCAAAFLSAAASALSGAATGNDTLIAIGAVCSMLSAGIYAACEAYVDAAAAREVEL